MIKFIEAIKELKKELEDVEMKLQAKFNVMSRKCNYREARFEHDGMFYNCNNPDYHLFEYTNIRPCGYKDCPKL